MFELCWRIRTKNPETEMIWAGRKQRLEQRIQRAPDDVPKVQFRAWVQGFRVATEKPS